MRDCVGRCDNVLALLCDNGLELTGGKMGKFVMDYLRLAATDKVFINVERLGWHGNRYGSSQMKFLARAVTKRSTMRRKTGCSIALVILQSGRNTLAAVV
jgi:hypothetical protein